MVAVCKKQISEGKIMKAFLESVYRIFFIVAVLWFALCCVSVNINNAITAQSFNLFALSVLSASISFVIFGIVDKKYPDA